MTLTIQAEISKKGFIKKKGINILPIKLNIQFVKKYNRKKNIEKGNL